MTSKNTLPTVEKQSLQEWADSSSEEDSTPVRSARYLLKLIWITIRQFSSNDLSLRSGALTYTILLSLVPMLAMSTAVVKGLGGGDQLREAAYTYLDTLENSQGFHIPGITNGKGDEKQPDEKKQTNKSESITAHLRSATDTIFDYVDKTNFATLGTFGVVGIFLSVLLVLNHIESAMNAIWKVNSGRSILRKISDYITLLILLPLSINVAFAASAFLKNPALSLKMDMLVPFEWIQTLLLQALPIGIIALSFYVMFIFFPNTKVKTVPALLGATLSAFLWFGVQNLYISLQIGVAKYNAIYGSFATLPLFLIWVYLGWMFILTGAQVAFSIQNVKTFRLTSLVEKPSMELGASFDILDKVFDGYDTRDKITKKSLQYTLPEYPARLIIDITDKLLGAGIIHLSQNDNRLLPTEKREQFDRMAVLTLILGNDAPKTDGGNLSLRAIHAAGEGCR